VISGSAGGYRKTPSPWKMLGFEYQEHCRHKRYTDITIAPPASGRALNAYVYQAEHRLSKETMAQVQTQIKLF